VSARVSIIVPLYNKAAQVERSLRSISAQSFDDYVVLVVDDGSTDEGPALVRRYGEADRRFRLITQANGGPGAARNRGIAGADSPLIAFLDADDAWAPDFLASSVAALDRHGDSVGAVTSSYWVEPQSADMTPLHLSRGLTNGQFRLTPTTSPELVVAALAFMSPWSTVARAEVFERWGGFYEKGCRYGEDAYLWLKVLLNETVVFQMQPLVHYHTEDSGLSNNAVRRTPVEPFLTDPDGIFSSCPDPLRPLLSQVLAIRAFKRACVLGYWGEAASARSLTERFDCPGSNRLPYYWPSRFAGKGAFASLSPLVRGVVGAVRLASGRRIAAARSAAHPHS
jgi:GT2 family glycosyltransferase